MSEIEWTRYSTKEWIGETDTGHEYSIFEISERGKPTHFIAKWANEIKPPYFVRQLGPPDSGQGVMTRLAKRCERHYRDTMSFRSWPFKPGTSYLIPPEEW